MSFHSLLIAAGVVLSGLLFSSGASAADQVSVEQRVKELHLMMDGKTLDQAFALARTQMKREDADYLMRAFEEVGYSKSEKIQLKSEKNKIWFPRLPEPIELRPDGKSVRYRKFVLQFQPGLSLSDNVERARRLMKDDKSDWSTLFIPRANAQDRGLSSSDAKGALLAFAMIVQPPLPAAPVIDGVAAMLGATTTDLRERGKEEDLRMIRPDAIKCEMQLRQLRTFQIGLVDSSTIEIIKENGQVRTYWISADGKSTQLDNVYNSLKFDAPKLFQDAEAKFCPEGKAGAIISNLTKKTGEPAQARVQEAKGPQ